MSVATTPTTPSGTPETEPILLHVDPKSLIIGANVRLDPRTDKDFIQSVRERGVLQAVTAYRDDEDGLVVLFGQRRTLAAVTTGGPTIPVMVVAQPVGRDRVIDQIRENDRRAGLLVSERVAAYEQLAAFGMSAGQIGKQLGTRRAEVERGLAVAGSRVAAAVGRWAFLTSR
jgi:ParB family transcriptional regulator, chromosome partitioning protein